jgi:DNA-binding transcriptional LysR family regulator
MSISPPSYKQNRLKQLRAFCKTVETKNISRAAEKLFLTQPTISLQIKALERELDVIVFERHGPQIRITPDGELLYEIAKPLLEGIDNLAQTFASKSGRLDSGELTIVAGESTILYLLPEFVSCFKDRHPGIHIKLLNETGRDGLAKLRSDAADFAVGPMVEGQADLDYTPLFAFEQVLIVPLDHPLARRTRVTLEEISPFGLILPPRQLNHWRTVDLVFEQHGVPYKVVLEAGGWEVIKRYVEQGMGISIVNEICLTGKERLAVIPMEEYFPRRTYGAVTRKGKFLTAQAQAFLDAMSTLQCKLPYKLAVAHGREEVLEQDGSASLHLPSNVADLD